MASRRWLRLVLVTALLAAAPTQFAMQAAADTTSEAAQAWSAAKDTASIAVLEDFIRRYPETFYATLARARLEELSQVKKPAQAEPLPPDAPSDKSPVPKMPDRFNPSSSDEVATEAPRAVLYVENPSDPKGDQYAGSVFWHSEPNWESGKMDIGVRADIEIPDRMKVKLAFRLNHDPGLPASHVIELTFTQREENPESVIAAVPGIMMKTAEQARGVLLEGVAVKVADGFFLVGLYNFDRERNVQLLKQRAWFDIPILYKNGRRTILALEKGSIGTQIFNDAFTAWKQ